jgi:hypothetical protein
VVLIYPRYPLDVPLLVSCFPSRSTAARDYPLRAYPNNSVYYRP